MGNDALLNTPSPVIPQVKDHTNNQPSQPHAMGKTKKQNRHNERQPGESAGLDPLPLPPHENTDEETPREQLLNKRSHQNSTKELNEYKKISGRNKLRSGKSVGQQNPDYEYQEANKKGRKPELELEIITLDEKKQQQKSDKNLESIAKINISSKILKQRLNKHIGQKRDYVLKHANKVIG